jgi:multidrug resistance efflux pump
LSAFLPSIRQDLEVTTCLADGKAFRYIVKDPINGKIYELREAEYFLWQKLDGQNSIASIQSDFQNHYGVSMPAGQCDAFVRHLNTLGLLDSDSKLADRMLQPDSRIRIRRLGDPDRLLRALNTCFSWTFTRFFGAVLCLFLIMSIYMAVKFGSDIVYEVKLTWEIKRLILAVLIGVFIVHPIGEVAKAVACKHYGGRVYEGGIWFLYGGIPRVYFDTSDAIWVMGKSKREKVIFAGLLWQLGMWGASWVGWINTSASSTMHVFWLSLLLASTVVLLLNAIPFFEQDGYYLLSSRLGISDLRSRAVALFRSWILRKPIPEPLSLREISRFRWYGVWWTTFQTAFWGILLGLIIYGLITWLNGIGAIISLILLYLRFGHHLKALSLKPVLMRKIFINDSPAFIRLRLLTRFGLLIILIIVALLPYPFTVGGEFRLLPIQQIGIRPQVTSEIKAVFVTEGQWVKPGEVLAKLSGRDQKKKVEATRAALDEAQARLDLLLQGPKPEAIARAQQEVQTAAKSLEYSALQADRYAKLVKDNAASVQSYENALKMRDMDKERLELARRSLELVKSGARDEEIRALEAEIRLLQVELSHAEEDFKLTELTSPIAGRVITPYLSQKIGQTLLEGDLFAVVEDAHRIVAEIVVPEESIGEVSIGSRVTLKPWGYPTRSFSGEVVEIAPVAYEKSIERVERALSEREHLYGRTQILREEGKVVRVLSELSNEDGYLKTDMTGFAKIDCENKPVIVAFSRWLVRFIMVEVWSWIP